MRKSKQTPPKTGSPLKPQVDAREGNIYDKMIKENLRMCDYHIMLKRKHKKLPIIHFVLYIGNKDPKHIKGFWQSESMTFYYKVIILKDIPYETFLKAPNPETVVFSILADFQNENPEIVAKKISDRLKALAETDSLREKYYTQLRVLSNIRKLQPIIDKVMANIFKMIDISEDPLYVKGIKEGKFESKIEDVKSLIIKTEFDDSYIAFLMSVPVELVNQIRQKLVGEKEKNGH